MNLQEIYLVYLAYTPTSTFDLTNDSGDFTIEWLNPVSEPGVMSHFSYIKVEKT